MNKPWLGYLSSVFLFFAGILMLVAKKYIVAAIFIGTAIIGLIVKFKMNKKD